MYLRRIELQGFKSFADRAALDLEPGVTAVVGPNGAGKSNLVEGVRWVVGAEHARALRGQRMEDVIFSGSDARRPLGFAEVALVLDNADGELPLDFTEVTVTRRVDRSGQSECSINGVPCRLKDVAELFMDTGLGREAYAVIGQGEVEAVLSARPEERRGLVEEAAGITRYRARKQEALRRLEETASALVRVGDVILELEHQFGPLEGQAEAARTYHRLRSELTDLEVRLGVDAARRLEADATALEAAIEGWVQRLEEAEGGLSGAEEDSDAGRDALADNDARRMAARTAAAQARAAQDAARDRVHRAAQEVLLRQGEGERHAAARAELQARLEALREAEDAQTAGAAVLKDAAAAAAAHLEERQAAADAAVARQRAAGEKLAAARREMEAVRHRLAELEARAARAEEAARLRADEAARLGEAEGATAAEAAALERRLEEARRALADARRAAGGQAEAQKAAEAARDAAEGRRAESAGSLEAARTAAREVEARLRALEGLEGALEGYAPGVRRALEACAGWARGRVLGPLARLVSVDDGAARAFEAALGERVAAVVVAGPEDARALQEAMGSEWTGRVTVIPLRGPDPAATVGGYATGSPGAAESAAVGYFLADRVAPDPAVAALVGEWLRGVVVAPDLEAARAAVARGAPLAVTPRGERVSAAGVEEWVGRGAEGGLVARRAAIARLRADAEASAADEAEAAERLARVEEAVRQARARVAAGAEARQALAVEVAARERDVAALEEALRAAAERRDALARRREALEAADRADAHALAALEQERAALAGRLEASSAAEKAAAAEVALAAARAEEALGALGDARVAAAAEAERAAGAARERDRLRGELDAVAERSKTAEAMAGAARTAARASEKALEAARTAAERADREAAEAEAALAGLEDERRQLEGRLADAERAARGHRRRAADWTARRLEAERELARVKAERAMVLRRLAEDYEQPYPEIMERVGPLDDGDAARERTRELRAALEAMGPVNLGAIEEWQRVRERHGFLVAQRDDLEAARAQLEGVIAEVDREMGDRFLAAYQQIREAFQVVFAEMFEGGRADLVLTDPEVPLEAGLEIVAQPPKKALQPLAMLSGGERALTAIALLFALLRVRPSPFCILDEIDAALDDANVARFTRYLRERSRDTQFLLVTHNKGTMEAATVLYGVTLESGGVSKLVSVRLADAVSRSA